MTSQRRSLFAPINLPDGRVAQYIWSRRAYVVISKAEHDRLLNGTFVVIIMTFLLLVPCFLLWYWYTRNIIGLEIPVLATAVAVIIAAVVENRLLEESKDALMRAPLHHGETPKLNLSSFNATVMAMFDDRRLARMILGLFVIAALAAFHLVGSLFGIDPDPVRKDMIVTSAIMLPVSLVLLRALRREQARRKTLAHDNPHP
ncbi:hypothetical protein [Rhizobium sp. LjRoot254]|uniref:hypothetical protein n=1 Tax=Rhizobium sp. LjRoot254 TaxID=3342297 RepID=UPI003ECD8B17